MSVVLTRAEALAQAIAECDELKEARRCQAEVNGDPAAEAIINDFFRVQTQIMELQNQGKEPTDELNEEFNDIQDKMEGNLKVATYYQAQANLGRLLQEINEMITEAVTGEQCTEEMCETCSGC